MEHPLLEQEVMALVLEGVVNPYLEEVVKELLPAKELFQVATIFHPFFHHLADSYGSPHLRWGKLYP
jgi:hypothetical protein